MTVVWSGNQRGYDVNELTCSFNYVYHHAVLIITGQQ